MGKLGNKPDDATAASDAKSQPPRIASQPRQLGRRLTFSFAGLERPQLHKVEFRYSDSSKVAACGEGLTRYFGWTAVPQALPYQSAPVETPASEVKSNAETVDSAALAQAALEAQRRQEQEKANAALEAQRRQQAERSAALEVQKQQEKEKATALEMQKRQEREKMIEQITSTLTNQVALLSQFKTDCQTRFDNNTNKLAKVAYSSRKSLTKNNEDFRQKVAKNAQIEETSLDNMQKDMRVVSANPQVDPRDRSRIS